MRILVIEDDSVRARFFIEKMGKYDLIITESAPMAIEYLASDTFDYIFMDHDLGENNGCGSDIVSYLYNNQDNPNFNTSVFIHSWNVVASQNMIVKIPHAMFSPYGSAGFFEYVVNNF